VSIWLIGRNQRKDTLTVEYFDTVRAVAARTR
jgi:hypothetical protein